LAFFKNKKLQKTLKRTKITIFASKSQTGNPAEQKCRSRQIFLCAKDFCPNVPKLAQNIFRPLFVRIFSHEDHFSDDLQKCLHVILGAVFFKSKNVGRHFFISKHVGHYICPYFQEVCPDFQGFCISFHSFWPVSKDFAKVFTDFAEISKDFARIFIKSKLLGERLHPLHPPSYTPAAEVKSHPLSQASFIRCCVTHESHS